MSNTAEKNRIRATAYYLAHQNEIRMRRQTPEFKARQTAYNRKSYLDHQDERKEYRRLYCIAHHDEIKIKKSAADKAYRLSHGDEVRAKKKAYSRRPGVKERHAANGRKWSLKSKYSMTIADKDALLAKQEGKCAICRSERFNGPGPCIDHDHTTGKIRGILCFNCNFVLGYAHNNPLVLRLAADYLETINGKK
jgi:hypothetical protein